MNLFNFVPAIVSRIKSIYPAPIIVRVACICTVGIMLVNSAGAQQFALINSYLLDGQKIMYGQQGVSSPVNQPGHRHDSSVWRTSDGSIYVFGGDGNVRFRKGLLNDLWKYNPSTNEWIWLKGSSSVAVAGVYGSLGNANANNAPGSRRGASTWVDSAGSLYLFGGYGHGATGLGYLNDLWKYNLQTNQWTWIKGSNSANPTATYGTLGSPGNNNTPGGRTGTAWQGADGLFYLFGGTGYTATTSGLLNDIWRYNPQTNQWAWIKGSNVPDQSGVYGTLGTPAAANVPGARSNNVVWQAADGFLYMFGGDGYNSSTSRVTLCDLWRYNASNNQWTWIKGPELGAQASSYGTMGTPAASNRPGSRRSSITWTGMDGALYLLGGYGLGTSSTWMHSELGDLWKYDPATNNWTWIKGGTTTGQAGIFGTMGIPAPANTPGSRASAVAWINADGRLNFFGGYGSTGTHNGVLNDIWQYNTTTNEWVWLKGSHHYTAQGNYKTAGIADLGNTPGILHNSMSWTGTDGALYLFGGEGFTVENHGRLNDLWKYSPEADRWTWIKGSNVRDSNGVYGVLGTPAPGNLPGGRTGAFTWTGVDGTLFLFGGEGFSAASLSSLNDMWKYNPTSNQWTWIKGSSSGNQNGVYGTMGEAAPANIPGARSYGVSWTGLDGSLYLFGGVGRHATDFGRLNDLWKYDPASNQWTWLKGSNAGNQSGAYGTRGSAAPTNSPGGRSAAAGWRGADGSLYLFGGAGYSTSLYGLLNDLWKYDPASNQWTWLKGANTRNQTTVFGTLGSPSVSGTPGARGLATGWVGADGRFYLFGGQNNPASEDQYMNELWQYNPQTNEWAWVKGSQSFNQDTIAGNAGLFEAGNTPSARTGAVSWRTSNGSVWLFGGYNSKFEYEHNDLWKFQIAPSSDVDLWQNY